MKRRIFAFIGLITIVGLILWQIVLNKTTVAQLVCESLIASGAIDRRYDELIRHVFSETMKEMNLLTKININSKYEKSKLNILVINFQLLNGERIANWSHAEFLNIAKDNFVAIPPNTILIDHAYLSFLILSSFNKQAAFIQGIDLANIDSTTGKIENPEIFQIHAAVSTLLSMGNYKWYKNNIGHNEAIATDQIAAIMGKVFMAEEPNEVIKKHWFLFFLPLVSHEIAHLEYCSAPISGWFDFKEYIQNILPAYAEEKKADAVMQDVVSKVVAKDKGVMTALPIIHFCQTMRNVVLVNAYDSFRNQRAEDLIITLEQKEKLSQKLRALRFDHIDRLARGYENPPPPMTEQEFYLFVKKFKEIGSNLTHRHLLHRCESLLQAIELSQKIDLNFNKKYLNILNVDNDTDTLFSQLFVEPLPKLTTGLSLSKIMDGLSKEVRVLPAINHINNKITLVFFNDGLGYLELAGDTADLAKISFIIRKPFPLVASTKESVRHLGRLAMFFLNCHQRPSMEIINKLMNALRGKRINIPAPFSIVADKNAMRFIPQNDSDYLRINVERIPFSDTADF